MSTRCSIAPNPDIAGVGARVAMYIQAVLTLVRPTLAGFEGPIDEEKLRDFHQLYLGILVPSCALTISAIVQAKTFGLSFYHGLIVLNLNLINHFSFILYMALLTRTYGDRREKRRKLTDSLAGLFVQVAQVLPLFDSSPTTAKLLDDIEAKLAVVEKEQLEVGDTTLGPQKEELHATIKELRVLQRFSTPMVHEESLENTHSQVSIDESLRDVANSIHHSYDVLKAILDSFGTLADSQIKVNLNSLVKKHWIVVGLSFLHIIFFTSFGIWLWYSDKEFGLSPECVPFTHLHIVFHSIRVTSSTLRAISISFYSLLSGFQLPGAIKEILLESHFEAITQHHTSRLSNLFNQYVGRHLRIQKFSQYVGWHLDSTLYVPSKAAYIYSTLAIQTYFITVNELTIKTNKHLINQDEEEKWTFGQTLAIGLISIPLLDVLKQVWNFEMSLIPRAMRSQWNIIKNSMAEVNQRVQENNRI